MSVADSGRVPPATTIRYVSTEDGVGSALGVLDVRGSHAPTYTPPYATSSVPHAEASTAQDTIRALSQAHGPQTRTTRRKTT
eukprot:3395477-Rhodomonas_salina.3